MSIYLLFSLIFAFIALSILIFLKIVKERLFCLLSDQEGYTSSSFDSSFIGREGIVVSDLRPAGFIEIDGVKCQAMSEGEYLKKDTKVMVIDGEGAHLIVK